jgi:hypothetical protein
MSFVVVDATNLSQKLVTTGGQVHVVFSPSFYCQAFCYLTIMIDGTFWKADDGIIGASSYINMTLDQLIDLLPGSHTLTIYWKVYNAAYPATMYAGYGTPADVHPQYWAQEVN